MAGTGYYYSGSGRQATNQERSHNKVILGEEPIWEINSILVESKDEKKYILVLTPKEGM